jgi:hypothetical protein
MGGMAFSSSCRAFTRIVLTVKPGAQPYVIDGFTSSSCPARKDILESCGKAADRFSRSGDSSSFQLGHLLGCIAKAALDPLYVTYSYHPALGDYPAATTRNALQCC